MSFHNRPLVSLAVSYILGILFARYFPLPVWIYVFILVLFLCALSGSLCFRISIFCIGCLFLSFSHKPVPQAGYAPLRENIHTLISYNVPYGEEKDLLLSLFTGERYRVSEGLKEILRGTNTMHILAISGLHIGFMGIMFLGMFRLIFIPRRAGALLACLAVFVYVTAVGWRPPAFRAAVMFTVFAGGIVFDRKTDVWNALALSAVIILMVSPYSLFAAGFQLSFIIVAGILAAGPLMKGGMLRKTVFGSFTAWIVSAPLTAYYFNIISPVSVPANIAVVPAVSIIVSLGFVSMLAGSLYLPLSGIFNAANYFFTACLIRFLRLLYNIPFGHFYTGSIYPGTVIAVLAGIFFFLYKSRSAVVK